jgi:NADPH-dependent curcumin reductase CurA
VVSAGAGATGSLVGQIAKIQGCRVVGIAGTDEKCAWITDTLGFDSAVNYKKGKLRGRLSRQCPEGIDVYFDSVGGKVLEAALDCINLHARVVFCGFISGYNTRGPVPGPSNYANILLKRARVEGFIVLDYRDRYPEAIAALAKWMAEGRIRYRLDVVDGLENAASALGRLFTGEHKGKLVVRVSEPG